VEKKYNKNAEKIKSHFALGTNKEAIKNKIIKTSGDKNRELKTCDAIKDELKLN